MVRAWGKAGDRDWSRVRSNGKSPRVVDTQQQPGARADGANLDDSQGGSSTGDAGSAGERARSKDPGTQEPRNPAGNSVVACGGDPLPALC